jgi:hypothetical protein
VTGSFALIIKISIRRFEIYPIAAIAMAEKINDEKKPAHPLIREEKAMIRNAMVRIVSRNIL